MVWAWVQLDLSLGLRIGLNLGLGTGLGPGLAQPGAGPGPGPEICEFLGVNVFFHLCKYWLEHWSACVFVRACVCVWMPTSFL